MMWMNMKSQLFGFTFVTGGFYSFLFQFQPQWWSHICQRVFLVYIACKKRHGENRRAERPRLHFHFQLSVVWPRPQHPPWHDDAECRCRGVLSGLSPDELSFTFHQGQGKGVRKGHRTSNKPNPKSWPKIAIQTEPWVYSTVTTLISVNVESCPGRRSRKWPSCLVLFLWSAAGFLPVASNWRLSCRVTSRRWMFGLGLSFGGEASLLLHSAAGCCSVTDWPEVRLQHQTVWQLLPTWANKLTSYVPKYQHIFIKLCIYLFK